MTPEAPDFINSEWLIIDSNGWRLKYGGPLDIVTKFNNFIEQLSMEIKVT